MGKGGKKNHVWLPSCGFEKHQWIIINLFYGEKALGIEECEKEIITISECLGISHITVSIFLLERDVRNELKCQGGQRRNSLQKKSL